MRKKPTVCYWMTGREDNLSHRCHFTMDSRLRGNDVVGALQQCLNNLVSTYWQARKMALSMSE